METKHIIIVSAVLLLFQGTAAEDPPNAEVKLYSDLTYDYHKLIRPVKNNNDSLQVEVGLSLIRILDFDTRKEILHSLVWLQQSWTDASLKWNPKDYNGITSIRMPHDAIWKPDIALYNSATDKWDYPRQTLAVVHYEGRVTFIPPMHLKSSCYVDITTFLFSDITCKLTLGSWTADGSLLNFTFLNGMESMELDNYKENPDWDLTDNRATKNVKYFDCCPQPYQDLTFQFTLRRPREQLRNKLVAPSVILAVLIPIVFLLPTGSSEKTFLGVGVLIGLVLMAIHFDGMVPAGHRFVSIIVLYNLICLILTAICLMFVAIINTAWAKTSDVPKPIRLLFLTVLGRLLCVGKEPSNPVPADQEAASEKKSQPEKGSGWRRLARVIDRLCLIVFILLIFILSIYTFCKR